MKMVFEIPDGHKASEAPELFRRFQEFLKDARVELQETGPEWDALIQEIQCLQESALAARELLDIYWLPKHSAPSVDSRERAGDWVRRYPKIDETFLFSLIEMAGERALEIGYSKHKSDVAKSKNLGPRTWVKKEWATRKDLGQSKASFSRQYAPLVKKRFGLGVTPETIARDWLPRIG